jgi:AcrR family transcriptional regulator
MVQDVGLRGYRIQDPERTRSRKHEIMVAAANVIWEKGYAATTLEDVATRLGVTRTVIYYLFRSKEDLYVEICLKAVEEATARLDDIVSREQPPERALFAILVDLVRAGFETLTRSTLATGRPRQMTTDARSRIRAADREYERRLVAVIEAGMSSGEFEERDPNFVAYTLIFAVHGSATWRRPDGPLGEEYFAEHLPRMLLNSVLAHPHSTPLPAKVRA